MLMLLMPLLSAAGRSSSFSSSLCFVDVDVAVVVFVVDIAVVVFVAFHVQF